MKMNHTIALLQQGFTTIKVELAAAQIYTYKAPDSAKVEKGDHVVVVMPGGHYRVLPVVAVDTVPDIDIDSDIEYKWIVQKVDFTAYNDLLAKEDEAKKMLTDMAREKKRKEIVEEHLKGIGLSRSEKKRLEDLTTL